MTVEDAGDRGIGRIAPLHPRIEEGDASLDPVGFVGLVAPPYKFDRFRGHVPTIIASEYTAI
jgi:hypothetical protein